MSNWNRPEVILQIDELNRRRLVFQVLGRSHDIRLVLDSDVDEYRETKRHKWKAVRDKQWHRLDHRLSGMKRREVPQRAIDDALEQVRRSIKYVDE